MRLEVHYSEIIEIPQEETVDREAELMIVYRKKKMAPFEASSCGGKLGVLY